MADDSEKQSDFMNGVRLFNPHIDELMARLAEKYPEIANATAEELLAIIEKGNPETAEALRGLRSCLPPCPEDLKALGAEEAFDE